jgi:hypothetical protein
MIYVGCYQSEDQFPENNDKCWTESECTAELRAKKVTPTSSSFGGQSPYCPKQIGGTIMGYCYGKGTPTKLNVPILGHVEIGSLPEYIDLAYRFLIPAMSLVAVVMIMVGGLQYMTARGNAKAVTEAKARITNALMGLVLLLGAYVIANLIDPRLTSLAGLRVPLLKQNVLLEPDATCEALRDIYGFGISPSSGACGKSGKIISIDNVKPIASNSNFKVGSKCDFSTCANGKSCLPNGDTNGCFSCADIATLSTSGPTPSDYICSQAGIRSDANDGREDHKYYCAFFTGSGTGATTPNRCQAVGNSVVEQYIDCAKVRENVSAGSDPCSVYDSVNVVETYTTVTSSTTPISSVPISYIPLVAKVCQDDICGVARVQAKTCALSYHSLSGGWIDYTGVGGIVDGILSETGMLDNHCITNE